MCWERCDVRTVYSCERSFLVRLMKYRLSCTTNTIDTGYYINTFLTDDPQTLTRLLFPARYFSTSSICTLALIELVTILTAKRFANAQDTIHAERSRAVSRRSSSQRHTRSIIYSSYFSFGLLQFIVSVTELLYRTILIMTEVGVPILKRYQPWPTIFTPRNGRKQAFNIILTLLSV